MKLRQLSNSEIGDSYCDIDSTGVFRKPSELLSREAARALIASAKGDLERARLSFHEKSFEDLKTTTERDSAQWLMDSVRSAELFNKYEFGSISEEERKELYQKFGFSESESRAEVLRISRRHARQMYAAVADPNITRHGRKGKGEDKDLGSLASAIVQAKKILMQD